MGVNALDSVNPAGGINNTAVGFDALTANTTAIITWRLVLGRFTATPLATLTWPLGRRRSANNNANFNLAIGFRVGFMNTTGSHLTGIGAAAMRNNTTAGFNTAIGADALRENTISEANVALGDSALSSYNGTNPGIDGFNTALGSIALTALTSGFQNTAVGRRALEFLTAGNNNVAVGWRSGDGLTTGNGNTFIGTQAGATTPKTRTYNNIILSRHHVAIPNCRIAH